MRVLLLVLFFIANLFAVDIATAIKAIKANPALLDTPQAQQMMQQKGISKTQVLQKIDGTKEVKAENRVKIKNKIDDGLKDDEDKSESKQYWRPW